MLEQWKEELMDAYDADELVDVLGISAEELLKAFEDKVIEYYAD